MTQDYHEKLIESNYWTLHKYTEMVEGRVEKLEERVKERTSDNQDTLAEIQDELVKFRAILIDQEERLKKVEAIQKFDNRAYKLNGGDVLDAIIERAKKK